MAKDVLSYLLDNQDTYVSGEYIAHKLGITRQAVSKRITQLKEQGFEIDSRTNKGYRVVSYPDVILPELIERETSFGPVIHFDTIDSTNIHARKCALDGSPERTLIVAEEQKAGRGRLGREWVSPKGGLWFSFIIRPRCNPSSAPLINFVAANAVAKTAHDMYGIDVSMKWPNDIYYEDRKMCGIALLVSSDTDLIHYLVVGIGINVNNDPPQPTHTVSLKDIVSRPIDRNSLLISVLDHFKDEYAHFESGDYEALLSYSRSISNTIGRFVRVSFLGRDVVGKVRDINDQGALVLEHDGTTHVVYAGDVDFLRPL